MSMTITRKDIRPDGIFGELTEDDGKFFAVTLERFYESGAKIPVGKYKCVRYLSPKLGYEVFTILDVPNAEYCHFHIGNFNEESDGCVLVGTGIGHKLNGGLMITASKAAFDRFMKLHDGVDEFDLTVEEV